MKRVLFALFVLVAGCADLPADGELRCNPNPMRQCPSGYHCSSGFCYAGPTDMAAGNTDDHDMAVSSQPGADMVSCGAAGETCCGGSTCSRANLSCTADNLCRASDVWAVGNGTATFHWDGLMWTKTALAVPSGMADVSLESVWGTSPGDVWAVGFSSTGHSDGIREGVVYRFNGQSWKLCASPDPCASPTKTALGYIFGSGPNDVWVIGANSSTDVYNWNGVAWSLKASGIGAGTSFRGAWCAKKNDCWAVGSDAPSGTFVAQAYRWDGAMWTRANSISTQGDLSAVYGFASDDVWAVGRDGAYKSLLIHFNGVEWSSNVALTNGKPLSAIWGTSPSDIWAVGSDDYAAHKDATGWSSKPLGLSVLRLNAVWGSTPNDFWIASDDLMLHWDGTSLKTTQPDGATYTKAVWGSR
jgi:hypothetical protein